MNVIDLIVYLTLLLAVWDGWRKGVILQVCSLAGLVVGIWLAARYGLVVGGWLHLSEGVAWAGGFAVVLVVTLLAVALAGRALRKLFRFAGLGLPDIVLGIVVAMAKYLLLLSVLFSAFDKFNADFDLVEAQYFEDSRWFAPVASICDHIFPFLNWVGTQVTD